MSDHVPGTMHRDQHGNVIEDYHMCGCQPVERSAGAAPLDVERLHEMMLGCDEGCFHWGEGQDGMRRDKPGAIHSKHAAEYARLSDDDDPFRDERTGRTDAGAVTEDVTWNALKATLRHAIAPSEATPTEYEHSFVIRVPLDVLVDAITEATPMIRDWLADEGPNTLDVARFIADRLGSTDR